MKAYARWLFGVGAAFNLLVGLSLLFFQAAVVELFHLDPIAGSNVATASLTGMFVALFGYAYALIAVDPVQNRPFISFGAIGKLLAVVCIFITWYRGLIPASLASLVIGDFVFALLFLDFLRRTRAG